MDKGKSKRNVQPELNSEKLIMHPSEDSDSESDYSEDDKVSYIEESSESEPELDCDLWDVDCKVISINQSELVGSHLMPTCSRNPELQPTPKKQKIAPEISNNLTNSEFTAAFKSNWAANTNSTNDPQIEIITEPFKLCVVKNFLENPSLLDEVRQEFYELDWNQRNMDLYEMFQSRDLKYLDLPYICIIYNFLKTTAMQWVADLTGINLTQISATCSLYSHSDYLLVHDDLREDRLIAFVLYLTGAEGWDVTKGGALELLSKDESGHPLAKVRDVFPANNQLVFFPVTNESYHRVAEVTCLHDCRLSINGWFYSKVQPTFVSPVYKALETGLYGKNFLQAKLVDIELEAWINEDYLQKHAIAQIQKHIEENSEISLPGFFKKESFNAVLQVLSSEDLKWSRIGPPNRYSYESIVIENLPQTIERFLDLFQSNEMFNLLQHYTDLELVSMRYELQRWTPGCYSLLTDYDWQANNELDLIIYFGCKSSTEVIGARTQYVTIEDEIQNALITIEPNQNNMNIIYRDSARFTKYYSELSKCKVFYTLVCSYTE